MILTYRFDFETKDLAGVYVFHENNHFGHVLELEMATVIFTKNTESNIWFRLTFPVIAYKSYSTLNIIDIHIAVRWQDLHTVKPTQYVMKGKALEYSAPVGSSRLMFKQWPSDTIGTEQEFADAHR